MSPEQPVTVWTCMSCGVIGDAQSCGNCGHEAMPGRWLEADGVERQLKDVWQQRQCQDDVYKAKKAFIHAQELLEEVTNFESDAKQKYIKSKSRLRKISEDK